MIQHNIKMNIYRSYFEKNNTIVKNSELNTAKNQITEIAYGSNNYVFSKYIFKVDLTGLNNKILSRQITSDKIESHILYLKNTINLSSTKNTDLIQERASSFDLVLFKINEDWDEGNGYDIVLNSNDILLRGKNTNPSNWIYKKTNEEWNTNGINNYSDIEIINTLHFNNGDEDFIVDLTDHINNIIYSGDVNYGLGISFPLDYDKYIDLSGNVNPNYIFNENIQSVNFHTKYTNTYFEPYLETTFNNLINDSRNSFTLNTDNRLYFFAKTGNVFYNVTMKNVYIYDQNDELVLTLNSNEIMKHSKGIYYVEFNLDSGTYIDSVLFKDEWVFDNANNEEKNITNNFYIISDNYRQEILNNLVNLKIFGIYNNKVIKRGDEINIDFSFNSLFENNINWGDYEFKYDLYVKYNGNNLYLIKNGKVNKVPNKYFINFDSNIFVPNNYYLDINLNCLGTNINSININFKIVD